MRLRARERFESEYTPDRNLAMLLDIYERALNKNRSAQVAA